MTFILFRSIEISKFYFEFVTLVSSLFPLLEIGKKESARETKLVLFPVKKALYEDIQTGAKNLVEISKEMVESRWEVPIQFLSYVREER